MYVEKLCPSLPAPGSEPDSGRLRKRRSPGWRHSVPSPAPLDYSTAAPAGTNGGPTNTSGALLTPA
ncbi:hypothetical protein GCM10008955_10190 [Deinococcus malanensis]|uniref:Uncharacterized protein n=1 Tax=Deinococcus malanensis TaxID=1706855 RepID=A0ABQ2EP18_9DEIO|nr:hypothetical protein GCM10008955_10190 [Deinococcus malanensis]